MYFLRWTHLGQITNLLVNWAKTETDSEHVKGLPSFWKIKHYNINGILQYDHVKDDIQLKIALSYTRLCQMENNKYIFKSHILGIYLHIL